VTTAEADSGGHHPRPALRLGCWGSIAAAALYIVVTASALPPPAPVAPAGGTLHWWTTTPVEQMLGGAARLVVISVLGYLVLVAGTQLLALLAPGTWWAAAVDRLAPRALALTTAGLIAASGPTAAATPAFTATPPSGERGGVTMQVLPSSNSSPGSPAAEPRTSIPVAPTTTTTTRPAPAPAPTPPSPPSQMTPTRQTTPARHVVEPGDHLWNIAERAVSLDGTAADASVVARYWRALIDSNRDRLVDPHDPDLILPGQELELPSFSDRGAR